MKSHRVIPAGFFAICVLTCALVVGAENAAKQTVWVYEGGWFSTKDNSHWIEWNSDVYRDQGTPFQFREVARNDSYVELYDASRRMFLRLTDSEMAWRLEGQYTWNVRYQGHWKK
jgi:hypothetical protein